MKTLTTAAAMFFCSLALFATPPPRTSGPDQSGYINQAYNAKKRDEALAAEAARDREVLKHYQEMETEARRIYDEQNQVCLAMTNPAATECARRICASLNSTLQILKQAQLEELEIHRRNIESINRVWDARGYWDPAARAGQQSNAPPRSCQPCRSQ